MSEPSSPQANQFEESTSSPPGIGGGVNLGGQRDVTVRGDVTGRDKIESAGGHIIHAGAGATIVIGDHPIEPPVSARDESPAPGGPPFKGLQYFDESDAELFFGRETLSAQLAARLQNEAFLAVVGASGSGKSSLVRAGLIPLIQREQPHWPIHVITPTAHPLKELAATLTRDVESVSATATLIDDFKANAQSLDLAVDKLLKKNARGERLLIVVDQFEELFTTCKDELERRAFVDNLLHATATATAGATRVVITLRADFYAHCAQFDQLREALAKRQEFIGAMSPDELRRAIEEPAKQGGWKLEPGLVDLMLHDIGAEPGALPLLSHALLETWRRRQGHTLTLSGYAAVGGVRGAIARTADAVLDSLDTEGRALMQFIFLELTAVGEDVPDTRRRTSRADLVGRAKPIEPILKRLADERLIAIDRETVEVAHEALIREWPTMRRWLDEERSQLRVKRQLADAVEDWLRLDRDESVLYRGVRLAQLVEWQRRAHNRQLTENEADFFKASQVRRERDVRAERERRRLRWLLAGVINLVLLAVIILLVSEPLRQNSLRQQALSARPLRTIPGDQSQFDIAPVTNGQYRWCVEAGRCSEPVPSLSTYFGDVADLAVTGVDALQAQRYCAWLGRRLPYWTEWQLVNTARQSSADSGEIQGLTKDLEEWTATAWPTRTVMWDGQTATIPKYLIEVGTNLTALGAQATVEFRRASLGFRCALDVAK